ncbi:MAG: class I SAM-dependent RNA methyltransferase, partial [Lachnospiraceae bacterium]|nr:class I SAM-dependent RNA methyltransferase [Lachnospiraceae bacterium]
MEKITYILICHFGLERVLKTEIRKLGLEIKEVTDGEIKVLGDIKDIPRLNFNLRTCERVMIEVGTFKATTFEELFQNVKALPIEKYVPAFGAFPITKVNQDKNSILHSSMSIQSITKKALVERLKDAYKTAFLSEDKGRYPFRVKFNKDIASIRLDTTGDSLHKRGYRVKAGLAPIEETLAASLIKLTEYRYDSILIDPFCGSGTIPIEAAMIAGRLPVSIDRAFVSETWGDEKDVGRITALLTKKVWDDAKVEAKSIIDYDRIKSKDIKIFGFDIDPDMIRIAKDNAMRAGVASMIHFETRSVKDFINAECLKDIIGKDMGDKVKKIILSNPPYGERLEDKE